MSFCGCVWPILRWKFKGPFVSQEFRLELGLGIYLWWVRLMWMGLGMHLQKAAIQLHNICVCESKTHLSQSFTLLQELVQQPADIRAAKKPTEMTNDVISGSTHSQTCWCWVLCRLLISHSMLQLVLLNRFIVTSVFPHSDLFPWSYMKQTDGSHWQHFPLPIVFSVPVLSFCDIDTVCQSVWICSGRRTLFLNFIFIQVREELHSHLKNTLTGYTSLQWL